VYRSQQRSTDLYTDSTALLPAYVSVVAMNCDPFGSLAPHYSRLCTLSTFKQHFRDMEDVPNKPVALIRCDLSFQAPRSLD
jgi:hypothetical protein